MIEEFEFAHLHPWVHLLWSAPAALLLVLWGIASRARTVRRFGIGGGNADRWLASVRGRRRARGVLLAVSLAFFATAAMQPRCNPEKQSIKRSSRDIAILIDVSRSMLAQDLQPSRLERAKEELLRLADRLRGDRVGLIAFAGNAEIVCPLTRNLSYFRTTVRNLSTASASEGGTHIGDAIRKALDDLLHIEGETLIEEDDKDGAVGRTVLDEELKGRKETYADILLITDGEDHASEPLYAARRAAHLNIGIYTVGLGAEGGSPIPIAGPSGEVEFLKNRDGDIVRTRLDTKTLLEMTNTAPRGAFLPVGTQNFDLADFYEQTIAKDSRRDTVETQIYWTEIYQPFVLGGLFFYALYLLVRERPRGGQLALETVE